MQWIDQIEVKTDSFEIKRSIIELCNSYKIKDNDLQLNKKVMDTFVRNYMKHKILFMKNDHRILKFIDQWDDYNNNNMIDSNHIDYLLFFYLKLSIGILKAEYSSIQDCHNVFLEYLNEQILSNGMLKNANEHDSLEYHVRNLDQIMELSLLFRLYGFYKFNYLDHILCCFQYLVPFLIRDKIHYLLINSIFQNDKSDPDWGSEWNRDKGIQLIEKYRHCDPSIEKIYLYLILQE